MLNDSPNNTTISLDNPEVAYLIQAAASLFDMTPDIDNIPSFKAMALQTENYDLANALDVLGTLYIQALEELSTGDHSSLRNAMAALLHHTGVVLHHLAQ